MSKMRKMHDVVIPIVTPLTDDDRIDTLSLQRLTDYLIEQNVDCLYPCGTTGEMVYLSMDERMLTVETVVKHAAGRVPVFAQVGAANTHDTILLARHAVSCGADGIGVVTPWYFQLSATALVKFYEEVSRAVPAGFPVYLYSIPQNAVNDLDVSTVERIAANCPNVIGIKYSAPNMTKLQAFMTVRNGSFDVLVGPDHLYEAVMAVGGQGVISGNAMVIPNHYCAIRDAIRQNDWSKATALQRRTNTLNAILCRQNNIGCYKAVLQKLGIISTNRMRHPMEELSDEDANALMQELHAAQYQLVAI